MRKIVTMVGILLIVTILNSGLAVAQPTWHYAQAVTDEEDTTNPLFARYDPDTYQASLGEHIPPAAPVLGWMILDLGLGNEMGDSQDFWVFSDSSESENYSVYISTAEFPDDWVAVNDEFSGEDDLANSDFTTPSTPGKDWRHIKLVGLSGSVTMGDPVYGPEIDAVGWYG